LLLLRHCWCCSEATPTILFLFIFAHMNLLTILQKERSKKTCIEVADYIGYSKERFSADVGVLANIIK